MAGIATYNLGDNEFTPMKLFAAALIALPLAILPSLAQAPQPGAPKQGGTLPICR